MRVITAIASASAPSEYSYTFDVPADTVLATSSAGFYLESGSSILGVILPPWATDASGRPVPTSYSWANSVLTQHVDLSSPAIDFPVLADPAWGYAFTFATSKAPAANKALLKRCFNCYFPVAGAPKQFPAPGQLLPLNVWGLPFECKFRADFTGTNYFRFQFDATKNHVDGLDSNIVFEFKLVGGARKLVVSAHVVNDPWPDIKRLYEAGAAYNWANFAHNLNAA